EDTGHERPGNSGQHIRGKVSNDGYEGSGEVGYGHARDRTCKEQWRGSQLWLGGPGYHAPDVTKARVRSQTDDSVGQPEPNRSLCLHQLRQCAVVDQRTTYRRDAACALPSLSIDQPA